MYLQHSDVNVLADDDDVPSTLPHTPTSAISLQNLLTKAVNQLGCEGQMYESTNKRKKITC